MTEMEGAMAAVYLPAPTRIPVVVTSLLPLEKSSVVTLHS